MARSTTLQVRTYRGHRLQLRDDGATGWTIAIHSACRNAAPVLLRNSVPSGLATLLAEAERRVDRRLNGAADGPSLGP
jgi:hypothetical protein